MRAGMITHFQRHQDGAVNGKQEGALPLIPFNNLKPSLTESSADIRRAAMRVIESGVFLGGDEVAAFEHEFAKYCCGQRFCVACASGTDAITLAVLGMDYCISGFNIQANGCKFTEMALRKAASFDEF